MTARKPPTPLTDGQLMAIVSADPGESTADVARRIGGDYYTVHKARQRIERDGWVCKLVWRECVVCGGPIASPGGSGARMAHSGCIRTRENARQRQRRKDRAPGSLSTPYVAKWRAEHPDEAKAVRDREKIAQREAWREKPIDDQRDDLATAHEATSESQAQTVDRAYNSGREWSAEDDAWLIAHNHLPARNIALTLSRTYYAVMGRRVYLRKKGSLDER